MSRSMKTCRSTRRPFPLLLNHCSPRSLDDRIVDSPEPLQPTITQSRTWGGGRSPQWTETQTVMEGHRLESWSDRRLYRRPSPPTSPFQGVYPWVTEEGGPSRPRPLFTRVGGTVRTPTTKNSWDSPSLLPLGGKVSLLCLGLSPSLDGSRATLYPTLTLGPDCFGFENGWWPRVSSRPETPHTHTPHTPRWWGPALGPCGPLGPEARRRSVTIFLRPVRFRSRLGGRGRATGAGEGDGRNRGENGSQDFYPPVHTRCRFRCCRPQCF